MKEKTHRMPQKTISQMIDYLSKVKTVEDKGKKLIFYMTPREVRVFDTMFPGVLPPEEVERVDLFREKELVMEVRPND